MAGVEVKAAASVTEADFRGLRKLRDAAGQQFAAGVVLYDGASAVRFGGNLFRPLADPVGEIPDTRAATGYEVTWSPIIETDAEWRERAQLGRVAAGKRLPGSAGEPADQRS